MNGSPVKAHQRRTDVSDLAEPIRYVPALIEETVSRWVWVDEDDAAQISKGKHDSELAYDLQQQAKDEEPHDASLTVRLAGRWDSPPEPLVGPVEACPHCRTPARRPDDVPVFHYHAKGCPLDDHHTDSRRDHEAKEWWADCRRCGWTGPRYPEEHSERGLLSSMIRVRLELDGREHLAGKPHNGSVRRDLGMPDLAPEYASWRTVPGYTVTHLMPARTAGAA